MKLEDVGERHVVRDITTLLNHKDMAIGIGDDCAAFPFGEYYLLITTDLISRKTHIPDIMSYHQIGWHIVAVNLSDIAAMGGTPTGFLASCGLPRNMKVRDFEEIARGMDSCCEEFGIRVLGGDTKETESLTLCGTALGKVRKEGILRRAGSQEGDIVAITGSLGKAACGYYSLQKGIDLPGAVKALLEPYPRVKEGEVLSESGLVTSCMDVSDGLASSLYQLSETTGNRFLIRLEDLPVAEEVSALEDIPVEELALYFGGDYELLFTMKRHGVEELKKSLRKVGSSLHEIGEVRTGPHNILQTTKGEEILENRGFEHFRKA